MTVTLKELQDIAKELKLPGRSWMSKAQLQEAIPVFQKTGKIPDMERMVPKKKGKDVLPKIEEEAPVEVKAKVKPKEKKARKPTNSSWINWCKSYAKENGVSYKEALKQKALYY